MYLSGPAAELLKASGRQLAEVIATGLGIEPEPREEVIRRVIREELAALSPGAALPRESSAAKGGPAPAACKHPHAIKGWCKDCETGGHYR